MEIVPKTPCQYHWQLRSRAKTGEIITVTCLGGAVPSPWLREPVAGVLLCTSVQFFICVSKLNPERVKALSAYSCLLKPAKNAPPWLAIPLQTDSSIPNLFRFISALVPKLEVSFPCQVPQSCSLAPLSHWVISYHFKMRAHGPMDSSPHIACSQPEVTTEHACMHLQHSHLSHVWCECHLREPAQQILRTHVHENELPHWYFLVLKFRHMFFLPLWKYRLTVDNFFYLGMLIVELCNGYLISSIMKVVVC